MCPWNLSSGRSEQQDSKVAGMTNVKNNYFMNRKICLGFIVTNKKDNNRCSRCEAASALKLASQEDRFEDLC